MLPSPKPSRITSNVSGKLRDIIHNIPPYETTLHYHLPQWKHRYSPLLKRGAGNLHSLTRCDDNQRPARETIQQPLTSHISGLIASALLLVTPYAGAHASIVFIAATPFVAVAVIIFTICDI
jgi:VIT1/CCC1 family predicted Fe2+/Mn2+ transporter